MNKFFDMIIPRFITEKVAVIKIDEEMYIVLCAEADLQHGDEFDFIAEAKSFNFFGKSYFAKVLIPDDEA